MINTNGHPNLDALFLLHNSASTSEVSLQLDIPFTSGINEVIIDIQSFLDDYSFEFDDLKSIMLISEKVLSRDWNSPEEDKAWAYL
ncbi:MAG: hypothetical protein IIC76_04950 [Bacteroidetes bacterium]|nr:hypothetical protein [Bacteroidota bacterium]